MGDETAPGGTTIHLPLSGSIDVNDLKNITADKVVNGEVFNN